MAPARRLRTGLRRRARRPDDTSAAAPRSPARSLRRRFLVPFGVGVAILCVGAGAAGAWGARAAADTELENRAHTSVQIFREAMLTQQARLEREASQLANTDQMSAAIASASSAELADLGISNTLSNRFDYVAVVGLEGQHIYSNRASDWSLLRNPELLASAAVGVTEGGLAVARDGTPVVFAAVPVRVPGARAGVIVVGEPVKAVNLEEIVRPLDLTMELRSSRGEGVNSLAGATDARPSVRTFTYPTDVSRFSLADASLHVGLSTTPRDRATVSAAATAAVVAGGLAISLLVFVAVLLDRAVLRPLRRLRAGIAAVEEGRYDVTLPPGGVREFVDVAAGFQRMVGIVGEQQARLREQAARDPLTGLDNHASFHAALTESALEAERDGTPLAVLVVDVDHFKAINDTHGHPFGDAVLRAIAQRLAAAVRVTDMAARVGGDEFAVLLQGADREWATEVAQRICDDLGCMPVDGAEFSVSVGIACFPEHTQDVTSLVEVADRALYLAKRSGRGQARSHEVTPGFSGVSADGVAAAERAQVVALLALPQPIEPVYQPVVALDGGAVVGYEALARFPSDPGGTPDVWFARARRCGLGPALEACAITAALRAPHRTGFLALNVSPSALLSPEVAAALPVRLDDLVLEITENEPITDEDALRRRLGELRARGARIALDDAGSGYAGLRQLLCVQPELLKLDRCLVDGVDTDLDRQAMIEAMVRFARRTGVLVCAEGVETLEQAGVLARLGVDFGQGHGLARPAPPWAPLSGPAATALGRGAAVAGSPPAVIPAVRRPAPVPVPQPR